MMFHAKGLWAMAKRRRDDDDGGLSTITRPETKSKTKKPQLYKVILHNDDYTTMEFVVHILQKVFHKAVKLLVVKLLYHYERFSNSKFSNLISVVDFISV